MKTFKGYISEARIYEPKYKAGYEFTLNERTPNAVHRALSNYIPGDPFKKSDKEPTIEINTQENSAWVAIVLEDKTGQIIRVWGSESALNKAFNKGSSATGGKMFAADWEEVITIAHNMGGTEASGPTMDEAAKLGGIKLHIKKKSIDKVNTPNLASGMLAGVRFGVFTLSIIFFLIGNLMPPSFAASSIVGPEASVPPILWAIVITSSQSAANILPPVAEDPLLNALFNADSDPQTLII
jgi:hypothetical protein